MKSFILVSNGTFTEETQMLDMLAPHRCYMKTYVMPKLATTSSCRKQIFEKQLGLRFFEMVNPYFNKDPTRLEVLTPEEYVKENSREKALSVARDCDWTTKRPIRFVLAADTVFLLDGEVLGKPESMKDNIEMLTKLSGKTHEVLTCVTVVYGKEKEDADGESVFLEKSFYDTTLVKIIDIPHNVIVTYVKTGELEDKTGGYSILGLGSTFVERIYGDYFNIIGLPSHRTAKELSALFDAKLI